MAGEDVGAYVEVPRTVGSGPKVRRAPASFDDHFSQVRLFWRSMTPVEQDHIVRAYTFELGKCYEQAVKERHLQCLANADPDLCAAVAEGLGLPVPEATVPLSEPEPRPALSQLGRTWPTDGRMVALCGRRHLRPRGGDGGPRGHARGRAAAVLAPMGGTLGNGMPVQRTLLTARSVEFDALGLTDADAGVVAPETPDDLASGVLALLGGHRAWERFPAVAAG